MAVVSESRDYLFLLHPRTGCTAVATGVMIPYQDGRWIPERDIYRNGRLVAEKKHSTVEQLVNEELLDPETLRSALTIVGVRNPFDSLVSLYHKIVTRYSRQVANPEHFFNRNRYAATETKIAVEEGLSKWVMFRYSSRRTRPPEHFGGKWVKDGEAFIRFEYLQDDLDAIMEGLGRKSSEVPRINVTGRGKGWQQYFDEEARELVESVFAPTFEKFGYSFYDDEARIGEL